MNQQKTKCGFSHYHKATPEFWRKMGDGLLAASTFISAYAVTEEIKWLALTSIFVGGIAKFLTNFFTKE